MWRFGLAAIVLGGAACGGTLSEPLTRTGARGECQLLCRREATCSTVDRDDGDCVDECEDELGGGGYRNDAIDDITACLDTLACSGGMAACLTECTPTATHEQFEDQCRAKQALCGGNGELCETTPSPTDPNIGFTCVYTPAVMQSLAGCLARPCEALEECFRDVLVTSGLLDQTHFHP